MNRENDNLQRRWEIAGPEVAEYLENAEGKLKKGDDTNITLPHHNPSHNKMFMKDSAIIIERLMAVNPFMEELFIKVGHRF